jgi:hypothetical protein
MLLARAGSRRPIVSSPPRRLTDNYCRVWARDAVVAAWLRSVLSMSNPGAFGGCPAQYTLCTLAGHQHVCTDSSHPTWRSRRSLPPEVSYGGLSGRVDATAWFALGCGYYAAFQERHGVPRTDGVPSGKSLRDHGCLGVQRKAPDVRAGRGKLGRRIPAAGLHAVRQCAAHGLPSKWLPGYGRVPSGRRKPGLCGRPFAKIFGLAPIAPTPITTRWP